MNCFECGKPAPHNHHIIPFSLGGDKTIPLCEICHGKIHGMNFTNHGNLIKKGLEKAKKEGRVGGIKSKHDYNKIILLREQGYTYSQIKKELDIKSCGLISSVIKKSGKGWLLGALDVKGHFLYKKRKQNEQ